MAQGLVGVGGTPRNISEIKVGVGGVRNVTEAYVGVGGAPRLCWSGDKFANKIYKIRSLGAQQNSPVELYSFDPYTFALGLLPPNLVSLGQSYYGAGVGKFYGGVPYKPYATNQMDAATYAVSKYLTMYEYVNTWKGVNISTRYPTNAVRKRDIVTSAYIGGYFFLSGVEKQYSSTTNTSAYFCTAVPMGCVVKCLDMSMEYSPIATTSIPYRQIYYAPVGESIAATDKPILATTNLTETGAAPYMLRSYDLSTYALIKEMSISDGTNRNYLVSLKTKKSLT